MAIKNNATYTCYKYADIQKSYEWTLEIEIGTETEYKSVDDLQDMTETGNVTMSPHNNVECVCYNDNNIGTRFMYHTYYEF